MVLVTKAAQKDTDARWAMKIGRGKVNADGKAQHDIAIPAFGYESHISIDARHGFIRRQMVTNAAAYDGVRLRKGLIDRANMASSVWADTAYRSQANESFLAGVGKTSQIHHCRKPKDKLMPKHHARANAKKSKVRARVETVFTHQKDRMNLMVRSSGIKRAEATVTMANIAYNLG